MIGIGTRDREGEIGGEIEIKPGRWIDFLARAVIVVVVVAVVVLVVVLVVVAIIVRVLVVVSAIIAIGKDNQKTLVVTC